MFIKRLAQFSSIVIIALIFSITLGTKVFSQTNNITATAFSTGARFIGTGLADGISAVNIKMVWQLDSSVVVVKDGVSVINNNFVSELTATTGRKYNYIVTDSSGLQLKAGIIDLPSGANTGEPSGSTPGNASGSNTGSPSGSNTGSPSGANTGSPSGSNTGSPSGSNTGSPSGANDTSGGSSSGGSEQILIKNPLKGINSLEGLIKAIIDIIFKVGSWVLAGFIIYTGYMFVAARGAPTELEKAKEALKYTLIGGLILLGAWVIAEAIIGTIQALE